MNLDDFANNVVFEAMRNIGASQMIDGRRIKTDSTGELRNSLRYEITQNRDSITIEFISDKDYADFVHDGVKGRKSTYRSAQESQYQYKNRMPPINQIIKHIDSKPVRIRQRVKRADGSVVFTKFAKKTAKAKKSLAFAIAKNIQEKGLHANPYFDNAIQRYINDLQNVNFIEILF